MVQLHHCQENGEDSQNKECSGSDLVVCVCVCVNKELCVGARTLYACACARLKVPTHADH